MELVSFKKMSVRVLDGQEQSATNFFEFKGRDNEGATQTAEISGLTAESIKTFGSDIAYHVSRKGTGDVKMNVTVLDLPFVAMAALLGYKAKDELYRIGADTEAPYCSVLLESEMPNGDKVYLGFFKGSFARENLNLETKKDKPEELKGVSLSYSALASDKEGTAGEYVVIYTGSDQTKINKLKQLLGFTAAG